ncbi:RsmE family RNA methyltransferase, partial [Bordetella bronchiseptica]
AIGCVVDGCPPGLPLEAADIQAELDLAGALARHAAHDDICLLVGPEGGWSDEELEQARAAGVQAVRFGPRVLRTETAGIALIAAVSAIRGWNG